MSLNFQSQKTFTNTLSSVDDPANICFNGSQEAVFDIEYLVGRQCFGIGAGNSGLDAVLLALNSSRDKHCLLPVNTHEILNNYESAMFSDVARRNGLNLIRNRPGALEKLTPPLQHIPYILDTFYSSPTQPRYRLGIATKRYIHEGHRSDLVAEVTVEYLTGDDTDEDGYHTIWIVNDNRRSIHHGVDTWLALVSPDGSDIQTLLQNRYGHGGLSNGKGITDNSSHRRSTTQGREQNQPGILFPYEKTSHEGIPGWPEPSSDLERGHSDLAAAPERIPGAPPFESSLPIHELSGCTMEELLVYYPEHVLHWPGLAILYNHYRFRLAQAIFEDATQLIKLARGGNFDISRRTFRRAIKHTGSQILHEYESSSFDGHMQPLSKAVQASGQTLGAFLESIIWTPPKDVNLQPPFSLSKIGAAVSRHPVGNFATRVLAAMGNQVSLAPANNYATQCHPIIKRCLYGSPEVDETMRETISLDYYPIHLPEEFVIQNYCRHLTHEPLLYVIIKHTTGAISRMVPEEACPDQTHAGFRTFSAKLRKRQQMALLQRGERRKMLFKGMEKEAYKAVYDSIKKEYQEERVRGGYGGIRVRDGSSEKRKIEEEEEDEGIDATQRLEPSRERRRTKKAKHGGRQDTHMPILYPTPNQPVYSGGDKPTSSMRTMMAAPMKQPSQVPWTTTITQQELGFDAPITSQNYLPSRPYPATLFDTELPCGYDQASFQNYDPQLDDSEQHPIFGTSTREAYGRDLGILPQFCSTIDSGAQSQYVSSQMPVGIERGDAGFTSMHTNYNIGQQSFQPTLDDGIVNADDFCEDTVAMPELTEEDWDQMINFEDELLLQPRRDDDAYRYGDPTTPQLLSNPTSLVVQDIVASSGSQIPNSCAETQPQNYGIAPRAELTHAPSFISSQRAYDYSPDDFDTNFSFLSTTHAAYSTAPPSIPHPAATTVNFEYLYPDPTADGTNNPYSLNQLVDTNALISDDFLENGALDVIEGYFPDTIAIAQGTEVALEEKEEQGDSGLGYPSRVEDESRTRFSTITESPPIDENGVEEWIEPVLEPVPGSGAAAGVAECAQVGSSDSEVVGKQGQERRGSTASIDSMASLFGE